MNMYGHGIVEHIKKTEQERNAHLSQLLFHLTYHPLNGKRRYRRGLNRYPSCGGFLNIIALDQKGAL